MMNTTTAATGEELGLFEAIRTTRAIHHLKPDPVPTELIHEVCEAGTFAPSGGNRQPWIFVADTKPAGRRVIADIDRSHFDIYITPAVKAAEDTPYPDAKRGNIKAAIWLSDRLHEAPVQLFVAG